MANPTVKQYVFDDDLTVIAIIQAFIGNNQLTLAQAINLSAERMGWLEHPIISGYMERDELTLAQFLQLSDAELATLLSEDAQTAIKNGKTADEFLFGSVEFSEVSEVSDVSDESDSEVQNNTYKVIPRSKAEKEKAQLLDGGQQDCCDCAIL